MAQWFKSVDCFVEDMSSVPSTHIKRFATPDPRALMPLASRGTCAHVRVPPNRHRHTHMLEKNKSESPKQVHKQRVYSLYNMGPLAVAHLVGKRLLYIFEDGQ